MTYSTHHEIYDAFKKCDEQWIQRRRKIDTSSLFYTLVKCCTQERGVGHILRMDNEHHTCYVVLAILLLDNFIVDRDQRK